MTKPPNNHYQALGLPSTATTYEIRTAFRRLAKAHHPDVSHRPDTTSNFQTILLAYKTLSNEEERRRYDHSLKPVHTKRPAPKPTQPACANNASMAKKQPPAAADPKRNLPQLPRNQKPGLRDLLQLQTRGGTLSELQQVQAPTMAQVLSLRLPERQTGKDTVTPPITTSARGRKSRPGPFR